jgi:tetratricopeptide (TPR) repeat protein
LQTIKNGSESEYYYAANSALQLGLIYEKRKDYKKARIYYEKARSMENEEYKNSIDQKAKAGLSRIEDK